LQLAAYDVGVVSLSMIVVVYQRLPVSYARLTVASTTARTIQSPSLVRPSRAMATGRS
jgi:hypothetical protein